MLDATLAPEGKVFIDKFDVDYRINCENNLNVTVKRLAEVQKELKDLEQVISKLEGGIYIFEQYIKEKYLLGDNANVDATTGEVTYKS